MKRAMTKTVLMVSRVIAFKPMRLLSTVRGIPAYYRDLIAYYRSSRRSSNFRLSLLDLYPIYGDRFYNAGVASGHYFHQDLWAAKKVYLAKPGMHVDVGSRIDGFVAHLLTFMSVTVVDVRRLESKVPGLKFMQGDVRNLSFEDESLESISSLHAIEHIGLGRYGDDVDSDGWMHGLGELQRILKRGGILYLGLPIGRERVCFNAHRVFKPATICGALPGLSLVSFYYVDDNGDLNEGNINFEGLPDLEYGCGLFEFRKV